VIKVGAPGGPTGAAFDKTTGRLQWGAGEEWGPSYASPVAADIHGKRKVFVFAGGESRPPTGGLMMIDMETGNLDFSFPWRSKSYESVNASTPVVAGNEVLVSATYRAGAALLRVRPDFSLEKAWESSELDLHWTTAMEKDGYFYAFAGRNEPDAVLRCVERKTGATVWSKVLEWDEEVVVNLQKRSISASPFRGSLMRVDGRWLAQGEWGHLLWLDLSPEGVKVDARTKLFFARESWSPPVVCRGLLYVSQNTRGFDGKPPRLLCFDLRAG
jgi:outer membrane protein assembly factor BamB